MIIVSIESSYYFPNCLVIETECGHRHVRHETIIGDVKIGMNWICYCEYEQ